MSDDQNTSLINKITELYHQFQKKLEAISHDQLAFTQDLMQKLDEAHQEEIRAKIQAEKL
jgi:hypothetical protein